MVVMTEVTFDRWSVFDDPAQATFSRWNHPAMIEIILSNHTPAMEVVVERHPKGLKCISQADIPTRRFIFPQGFIIEGQDRVIKDQPSVLKMPR